MEHGAQLSMWDGGSPLKIDKPLRLIELFAGIGAQAKALERLGVPFEHYRICEFDKYAVMSYNAIHGTDFKPSDIRDLKGADLGVIDTDKFTYILTYSFPCTDLSVAGKQAGMRKGTGTRSGLLWEVERLLSEMSGYSPHRHKPNGKIFSMTPYVDWYSPADQTKLPQILLMENVPQVIGKKNIKDFAEWVAFLDALGYTSKWAVLNATDFNVPQNRERCFMVSWLGDYSYYFPQGTGCKQQLKDRLEKNVDEKYYLSDKGVKYISSPKRHTDTVIVDEKSPIAPTAITAKGNSNWTGNFIADSVTPPPRFSKAVRASGRQSYDRHSWDIIVELRQDGGEGIDGGNAVHGEGLQGLRQSGADGRDRSVAEEVIEEADGTVVGRSSSFVPPPLKGISRAIDTEGKNGVFVWQKKS